MTPTQLANVRRLMKAQRARRRDAANRATADRDYEIALRQVSGGRALSHVARAYIEITTAELRAAGVL
jgi:hypothetical protein